jgi:hypothetical protein
VVIDIFIDNIICYIATSGAKESPAPEMATPISLSYIRKFLLNFTGRTSLSNFNKVTDRYMRGYLGKNMYTPLT